MMKLFLTLLISVCLANAQKFPIKAVSFIGGGITNSSIMIFGDIRFTQLDQVSPVTVRVNISFFPLTADLVPVERALHIHTFGVSEMSSEPTVTCMSTGDHWNPLNTNHAGHAGDLGNVLMTPTNGRILAEIKAEKLALFGEHSIIGRSVVLHEKIDDLGKGGVPASLVNGNAGKRIACGNIALEKP